MRHFWEILLGYIETGNPYRWMLTFDGNGLISLEHFPDEYCGALEAGSGDWAYTGSLQDTVKIVEGYLLAQPKEEEQ